MEFVFGRCGCCVIDCKVKDFSGDDGCWEIVYDVIVGLGFVCVCLCLFVLIVG